MPGLIFTIYNGQTKCLSLTYTAMCAPSPNQRGWHTSCHVDQEVGMLFQLHKLANIVKSCMCVQL